VNSDIGAIWAHAKQSTLKTLRWRR
jgi:hypothetical protein